MRRDYRTHRQDQAMRQWVHGSDVRRQRDCLQRPLQAVGGEGGLLQHAQDAVSLHPRKGRPCHLRTPKALPCTVSFCTVCKFLHRHCLMGLNLLP